MLKNKKLLLLILFCLALVGVVILLMFKITDFMTAYSFCLDDFTMIEKCQCFPLEGNYSYFNK
jgi:hypothetical protein